MFGPWRTICGSPLYMHIVITKKQKQKKFNSQFIGHNIHLLFFFFILHLFFTYIVITIFENL